MPLMRRGERRRAAEEDVAEGRGGGGAGRGRMAGARGAGRGRMAGARGAGAVGSVMLLIARLVRLIVGIIVALIVAGILLKVLSANLSNSIVKDIHDAAKFFVGPFNDIFKVKNPKTSIAVNWGLAALIYLVVGGFIASLIARAAPEGVSPRERV